MSMETKEKYYVEAQYVRSDGKSSAWFKWKNKEYTSIRRVFAALKSFSQSYNTEFNENNCWIIGQDRQVVYTKWKFRPVHIY